MAVLWHRKADKKDKNQIAIILNGAIAYLQEQNINQWQDQTLTINHLMAEIEAGKAYVWLDKMNSIQAFAILASNDPNYDQLIKGEWAHKLPYYAIHRVMIASESRGQGLTSIIFSDIEKIALEHHKQALRIDTHPDNLIMRHTIKKMGFQESGVTLVNDGTPRLTYEKSLV